MSRTIALVLTFLTGFSGLVYEVTWQKYVATLLGSHSEASASVLGIFLAGLSLGYAVFGRLTRKLVLRAKAEQRPARLLLTYAGVEIGIGLYAFAFPWLFAAVKRVSYAIPESVVGIGFGFDVLLVALLLGPPTVLMGGTIPLLTQALAKDLADATRFHALVYGVNTGGAFAGALAAAYLLIPGWGLFGTLLMMGFVNLTAGLVFGLLGFRGEAVQFEAIRSGPPIRVEGLAAYTLVALLSGFAMMVTQTVAIRLGGLAFGSSEFTFATVVAVFVLCIALGSFAVSLFPRISSRYLAINQCVLVAILIVLYLSLAQAPYWAHVLRIGFGRGAESFVGFSAASFLGFLAVFGPAAVLSGAVLPLLFHHLRKEVGDLGGVAGRIYSWNTIGAFFGALLGGYLLFFFVDLHHVFRVAIGALAISAAILTARLFPEFRRRYVAGGLALVLLGLTLLQPWNPDYLNMGLFRWRTATPSSYAGVDAMVEYIFGRTNNQIIWHDDDPVASITVTEVVSGDSYARSILTNGKSDGGTKGDYGTVSLLALIPALLSEKVERGFVIGYGTGISAGELARLESVNYVGVAEISPAVVEAAPLFDFANGNASTHPKIEIIRSDAFRALMRGGGEYDVIVSEPSNPWVTGIEMLYSREFLLSARERLAPGGVYAQWYHQYETDAQAVALVIRTFASVFERVSVWYTQGADLLVLGFEDADFEPSLERLVRRSQRSDIRAGLLRSGLESLPALLSHELVPVGVVHASELNGPVHTLYWPTLNHAASMAFFRGAVGRLPRLSNRTAARVGMENSLYRDYLSRLDVENRAAAKRAATREACMQRYDLCAALLAEWTQREPESLELKQLMESVQFPSNRFGGGVKASLVEDFARFYGRSGSVGDAAVPLQLAIDLTRGYLSNYQHLEPFDPQLLVDLWERCEAPSGAEARCAAGLDGARRLLGEPGLPPRNQ